MYKAALKTCILSSDQQGETALVAKKSDSMQVYKEICYLLRHTDLYFKDSWQNRKNGVYIGVIGELKPVVYK